jgi:threonylcarbamoyladenosine tRNA methylthiotransferase MtaB
VPRVAFFTLGCKVNQQETDSMRTMFERAGYETVAFEDPADVYVVNTCTVTQGSDKKSRQMISRAHALNPDGLIAVVGCYAQRAPAEVQRLPGVRLIVGTQHRSHWWSLWMPHGSRGNSALWRISALPARLRSFPHAAQGMRTRAQLKIQDGCDRYCSYCIIPYARGPVRSRSVEGNKSGAEAPWRSHNAGGRAYGHPSYELWKGSHGFAGLAHIVALAAHMPGIGRVRLGSLEPALLDDAFVRGLADIQAEKLCRQFHLSLQSGSNTVLSRMRRRYSAEEYAEAAYRLRRAFPGCAITTDVIAGFPGETEQEHRETMTFVERMAFARMHVFPYSRRSGTVAADMPGQLSREQKERRAHELIALGERLEQAYVREQIGTVQQVLPEEAHDGIAEGYTGNYIRVRFAGEAAAGLVPLSITGADGAIALGERV